MFVIILTLLALGAGAGVVTGSLIAPGFHPTFDLVCCFFGGSLTASGFHPTLDFVCSFFGGLGELTASGFHPTLDFVCCFLGGVASLAASGFHPTPDFFCSFFGLGAFFCLSVVALVSCAVYASPVNFAASCMLVPMAKLVCAGEEGFLG